MTKAQASDLQANWSCNTRAHSVSIGSKNYHALACVMSPIC